MKKAEFKIEFDSENQKIITSLNFDDGKTFYLATAGYLKEFMEDEEAIKQMIPFYVESVIKAHDSAIKQLEKDFVEGTSESIPEGFLNLSKKRNP